MHDSALVLPEMIEDGLRVLIYAGEYDVSQSLLNILLTSADLLLAPFYQAMCNWMGNVGDGSWPLKLETSLQEELLAADKKNWYAGGKKAGWVRQAGKGAGHLTLVKVANAGHMVSEKI